jgi:predicted O-linked N-acetylglucosamine transferase (SPINDLY family)
VREAQKNLLREAIARDVDPERLVFAPALEAAQAHLARYRLADLFLDTLPYNAHATACDALWAGLPVLTCRGGSFAGRVGASLLGALGMPELVTDNLDDYARTALELARDPQRMGKIRIRLEEQRRQSPAFDTARYCRNLEAAYAAMCARHRLVRS